MFGAAFVLRKQFFDTKFPLMHEFFFSFFFRGWVEKHFVRPCLLQICAETYIEPVNRPIACGHNNDMALKIYKMRPKNRATVGQPISHSGLGHWAKHIDDRPMGPNPWSANPLAQVYFLS